MPVHVKLKREEVVRIPECPGGHWHQIVSSEPHVTTSFYDSEDARG